MICTHVVQSFMLFLCLVQMCPHLKIYSLKNNNNNITHFLEYSASLFMFIHILAIGLFHWMPRVSRVPNGIC